MLIPTSHYVAAGGFITEFSYDSLSYDIANNYDFARGIAYGNGGDSLYFSRSEGTADEVGEIGLATTDSIGGSPTTNGKVNVASQDGLPEDADFKTDGTKMYVLGGANKTVYQYSLSTAWLASSASYDSVSFSVSGLSTVRRMKVSADGATMFINDIGNDLIQQYSLSTAWDLSTASIDTGVTLDYSSETLTASGFDFNSDGTILVVAAEAGTLYEYSLSSAYDLSTASYSGNSLDITAQCTAIDGIAFNSDDTVMFVLEDLSRGTIFQFSR